MKFKDLKCTVLVKHTIHADLLFRFLCFQYLAFGNESWDNKREIETSIKHYLRTIGKDGIHDRYFECKRVTCEEGWKEVEQNAQKIIVKFFPEIMYAVNT